MFTVVLCAVVCVCLQTALAQMVPGGAPPFRPFPGGPGPMPPPFARRPVPVRPFPGGPGSLGSMSGLPMVSPGQGPRPFLTGSLVHATCYFNDTYSPVKGRVDLRQDLSLGLQEIEVRVQVTGLPQTLMSDTEHGIHVHQWGDTSRSCYNTGPHFDTDEFSFHGAASSVGRLSRHDGDWSNLRQTNDGIIDTTFKVRNMMLVGDNGIIGRSIVLHEGKDDLGRGNTPTSLQTGNAGPPIACGVIGLSDSTNWNDPLLVNGRPAAFNPAMFPAGSPGFNANTMLG